MFHYFEQQKCCEYLPVSETLKNVFVLPKIRASDHGFCNANKIIFFRISN